MLKRLLAFRTRHQPYMVRLSYRYEMRSALTYPLAASLAEGSFTGVVAAKYFHASQLLIAVITAAPMFGNIMAMVWSELAARRPKVPFVNLLQLGVVLSIAAVALTGLPWLPLGAAAWIFAGLIILTRVLASGIITIRSVIWRANYPRYLRGQIIGRISIVATVVLAGATLIGSSLLDNNPRAFVYLYPGAAALGAIGIWQFSHIRVRREGQLLRRQQLYTPRPENLAQTDEANVMNFVPPRRWGFMGFFREASRVLREDKAFRTYQRWQFVSGFSFMMLGPSLLYMISQEMTEERTQYLLAAFVLQIIPMLTMLPSLTLWAPLFDRVHVTRFRTYQTIVSVTAMALIYLGAHLNLLWIVAMGQVFIGVTNAGGNLAWNLGHNDFATADRSAAYMGVHVMLTGLRGCFAPFVGVMLYKLWLGRHLFGVSTLVCCIALAGFWHMSLQASAKTARLATEPAPGGDQPRRQTVAGGHKPPPATSTTNSAR